MSHFQQLHQPTGRVLHLDNTDYLFFGGTAYLGLLNNADYKNIFIEGIHRYGLNNGTSRRNNVQLGIYDEAEQRLAARFGFADALLLSSGYLAAQLAVTQFSALGCCYYAPRCHPALWLNQQPVNDPANPDFNTWALATIAAINAAEAESFVILANTMDNLSPCYYDFTLFESVAADKQLLFILDDSHGIGVTAPNACAIDLSVFARDNFKLLVVASLAKGMGTDAGILLSDKNTIQKLRATALYSGASPPSPAGIYAMLAGEQVYLAAVEKLQQNFCYLSEKIGQEINYAARFPVFSIRHKHAYDLLKKEQILISSFAYPQESDPLINRIVITAAHQEGDLANLLAALKGLE